MYLQKIKEKKKIFLASCCRSLTKGAVSGSGSVGQRYGSRDPGPKCLGFLCESESNQRGKASLVLFCLKWMTQEGMNHLLENAEGILRGDEVAPLLHLVVVQREAVPGEPQHLRHHPLRGGDAQRRPPLLQLIRQLLQSVLVWIRNSFQGWADSEFHSGFESDHLKQF